MTFPLSSPQALNLFQRGAMFGMDARIALIVAAILTAAGGITIMSRLERSKVDQAEQGVEKVREGLAKYYQTVSINQLPDSLEPVFQSGVITDPGLRTDPWGNPWYYQHFATNVTLEGTPMTVHYAVISSGGKDGVNDSLGISSEQDYAQWEVGKDDVGVKFSSRDIEMARKEEYIARAQLIVNKLEAAEAAAFMEAQNSCNGNSGGTSSGKELPTWCSDLNGKNYTQFNFYPVSSLDNNNAVIYYQTKVLNKNVYQSGDGNDMEQLMTDLGLPASYAKDPWGRTIQYHSNITDRDSPPFSASVCFSFGENCFNRN